jgi:hypothetical protein
LRARGILRLTPGDFHSLPGERSGEDFPPKKRAASRVAAELGVTVWKIGRQVAIDASLSFPSSRRLIALITKYCIEVEIAKSIQERQDACRVSIRQELKIVVGDFVECIKSRQVGF